MLLPVLILLGVALGYLGQRMLAVRPRGAGSAKAFLITTIRLWLIAFPTLLMLGWLIRGLAPPNAGPFFPATFAAIWTGWLTLVWSPMLIAQLRRDGRGGLNGTTR